MKFSELQLHPDVLAGIEKLGFTECTDIQETAIPLVLQGKDVAGLAQTGTGKTAAYVIPLMDRILRSLVAPEAIEEEFKPRVIESWKESNFVLILVPTRELAEQVRDNVTTIGAGCDFKSVAVYGGMSYEIGRAHV